MGMMLSTQFLTSVFYVSINILEGKNFAMANWSVLMLVFPAEVIAGT